mmetsp:Transcript_38571/g.96630  ORF Transcript_38571/g.96630 Transcript_38571/m.96630 type:complete len:228 (+) Transcript_38571:2439-3122(+)
MDRGLPSSSATRALAFATHRVHGACLRIATTRAGFVRMRRRSLRICVTKTRPTDIGGPGAARCATRMSLWVQSRRAQRWDPRTPSTCAQAVIRRRALSTAGPRTTQRKLIATLSRALTIGCGMSRNAVHTSTSRRRRQGPRVARSAPKEPAMPRKGAGGMAALATARQTDATSWMEITSGWAARLGPMRSGRGCWNAAGMSMLGADRRALARLPESATTGGRRGERA